MDALDFSKITPEWLNQSLFEKAIRHNQNDSKAEVFEFSLKPASQAGQNFGSAIFRGSITYKSKFTKDKTTISVIIKTQPPGVDLPGLEHFKNPALFIVESEMYEKVLPEYATLLSSVGDKSVLYPRLIYQVLEPHPVIILEDVSVTGYDKMTDNPPDDFELSKRIIRKLAKMHAASFFLHHEKKLDYSTFCNSLYSKPDIAKAIFGASLNGFNEIIKTWDGVEKYLPAMQRYVENFFEMGSKCYQEAKGPFAFNVLNHGDFHARNVLYKMSTDDKVEDFIFIDYQICFYGSPAIDLSYALYLFLTDENRHKHRDEFIASYYHQFVDSLKSFGYLKAPPSLIDLQIELLRCGVLQAQVAIAVKSFFLLDLSTITPEEMTNPLAIHIKTYNNPIFKEMILKEFPYLVFRGCI